MSGNRRHWGGKFTEKHAYRFRLSRHPAWISENDLLMYRCNMSTLQALLGRTGDSSDRCGLVDGCIPSRGGSHGLKMERFTLHRSTLLHARMAIAVSAGISAGWLGPIGRAGAQTYWPATATYPPGNAANAGVSYQGNTELYDNKRGDNESALELQRAPVHALPHQPYMREMLWGDCLAGQYPTTRRRSFVTLWCRSWREHTCCREKFRWFKV